MATLRATQFAAGDITDGAKHDVYTVPTGKKIILKSIQLLEASGFACTVNIGSSAFGAFTVIALAAYPANGSAVHTRLWLVLNAGDKLQVQRSNAHEYTYVLSGSLMTI